MPAQVSLLLVVEPGAREGTIAGHLQDEQGVDHSFSGWLGLLSLLEAARARARFSARGLAVGPARRPAEMRSGGSRKARRA